MGHIKAIKSTFLNVIHSHFSHSFIRSFVHSFSHSFICSFVYCIPSPEWVFMGMCKCVCGFMQFVAIAIVCTYVCVLVMMDVHTQWRLF